MKRKRSESITDFKLRLCDSKDTLGLTWKEIAKIINEETGETVGESVHRKWYTNFSAGIDYAFENNADDLKLKQIAIQEANVKKERAKFSTYRTEINRWLREAGREEAIAENISEAIQSLEPVPKIKLKKKQNESNTPKVVTVDLADMHFGREGVIKGLRGETLSEYSEEIFYQRMEELLTETVEVLKRENADTVYVFNLGDSIDGLLRLTQLQFLAMGVIDSVMRLAEYLAQWLNKLSGYATVEYFSILGNHAEMRIGGIKSGELKQENLELIIPWFIRERLSSNNRITVHDAEFIQVVDVLGTKICLTHGQNEKNLENSIKDYMMIYGEQIHILKTGHLHHLNNRTIGMMGERNIEYIQSPSICGIDEYSMKLKKTANAGSLITVFTPKGKYCTYEVIL